MASKTLIVNIALLRIGVSTIVANVETELSQEAISANLIFDTERDAVLREFPWPWATSYAALGLVDGSSSDPVNDDWMLAYRQPPDCLFPRRLVTSIGRSETEPPPFKVGRDGSGRLIYTDQEDAVLEYTVRVTDPEEFDPLFVSMLAWRLGASLAPALSRLPKQAERAIAMYLIEKSNATARAGNESQAPAAPEADWIRGR